MNSRHAPGQSQGMRDFYDELTEYRLAPLWEVLRELVPPEPESPAIPAHWHYATVRELLMRAGTLITAEDAERRVLVLENPGLQAKGRITPSLYAGLQLVLPREIAPCHRHAQSALRFVLEGDGGYTAINGEKVGMRPFDLVLTPSGVWHDHGNETETPIVWLDGLDIPLVQTLACGYAEACAHKSFPETRRTGDTLMRHGKNLRPVRPSPEDVALRGQPLFHYPYEDWRGALAVMAEHDEPHAHDGYRMEFINPATGKAVMNTISAFCQLVPASVTTAPKQSTDGTIYAVCEGAGGAIIGGTEFPLSPRDVFVVPSWCPLSIRAAEDLVLFSFSDRAAQEQLGLWYEKLSSADQQSNR